MKRVITFRKAGQETRQQSKDFYRSRPWRDARKGVLLERPLCEDCEHRGQTTLATEVHHRLSRAARPDLALDWDNLVGLCKPCHSRRTGRGE